MTFSTQLKPVFLLGSGVSIPAGMPSTKCITEQVVSGKNIIRDMDGTYRLDQDQNTDATLTNEYVPRVLKFLDRLKVEIDRYYERQLERYTNYEDLYYVASQIYHSESREYDNPVVQPFIDKILPDIEYLLISKNNETQGGWQVSELAEEATHYIEDVVWSLLNKAPSRLDHLGILKDACLDDGLSGIDIFTLNHDRVLESYLLQNKIQFTDGFGKRENNNIRYWNPDLFESESSKVRLFKLHGSIDWFRFRPNNGDWSNESIGIYSGDDLWHTKNPQGQMQQPMDDRPMFLAGTFNKMFQYIKEVYVDLHCLFHRSLREAHRLVICGYSFGDKGINTRIINWIYSSADNKILVVHPDPEKLKNTARDAISNKWNKWKKENKLTIISKPIETTCWHDIKGNLSI